MSVPSSSPAASRLSQLVHLGLRGSLAKAADLAAFRYERWREQRLDRRWGVETTERVPAQRLDGGLVDRLGGAGYQGVSDRRFARIMAALRTHQPRTSALTFLDIGAGKGRAMLLAAQSPWRRIVGVELSSELVAHARANLRAYHDRFAQVTPVELVHGNALEVPLPDGPLVVFLYNPFGAAVLDGFIERLRQHHVDTGQELWVAYCNPVHQQVLLRASRAGWLRPVHCQDDWVLYCAPERPQYRLRAGT